MSNEFIGALMWAIPLTVLIVICLSGDKHSRKVEKEETERNDWLCP